jgi:hypothetical protein
MLSKLSVYVAVTMLLVSAAVCGAQGLADVARAEEARRKSVKAPSKTYTNDDLKGDNNGATIASPSAASGSADAPATSATPAQGAKPASATAAKPDAAKDAAAKDESKKDEPKKDEKYWRDRINAAQQAMARNKVLVDALQSRVNALNTDFVNTDDPAQRAVVEQNRKTALAEMDRVKKDIDTRSKEITAIQEEARKANVPSGWLR